MYRSPKDRKHRKVVAEFHKSKHWLYPEQCSPRFREPLEEIVSRRNSIFANSHKAFYVSPMIEDANDKWWDGYFNGQRNSVQIYTKAQRGEDVDWRTCESMGWVVTRRQMAKNNADYDYKAEAYDVMDARNVGLDFIDYPSDEEIDNVIKPRVPRFTEWEDDDYSYMTKDEIDELAIYEAWEFHENCNNGWMIEYNQPRIVWPDNNPQPSLEDEFPDNTYIPAPDLTTIDAPWKERY